MEPEIFIKRQKNTAKLKKCRSFGENKKNRSKMKFRLQIQQNSKILVKNRIFGQRTKVCSEI